MLMAAAFEMRHSSNAFDPWLSLRLGLKSGSVRSKMAICKRQAAMPKAANSIVIILDGEKHAMRPSTLACSPLRKPCQKFGNVSEGICRCAD